MVSQVLRAGALFITLGYALAQTYEVTNVDPDFPIKADNTLSVKYGGPDSDKLRQIITPGENWHATDVQDAPEIGGDDWGLDEDDDDTKAILILLDSDVPTKNHRTTMLHWFVSNITLGSKPFTAQLPSTPEASYRGPNPPAGDVSHAYTFVLFKQPADFDVSQFKDAIEKRSGFNVTEFVEKMGEMGGEERALAANYLRVKNETASATVSFPPARATGSKESPTKGADGEKVTGAAMGGEKVFWTGTLGAAVLAVVFAFGL